MGNQRFPSSTARPAATVSLSGAFFSLFQTTCHRLHRRAGRLVPEARGGSERGGEARRGVSPDSDGRDRLGEFPAAPLFGLLLPRDGAIGRTRVCLNRPDIR